ncbi:hypothetical protein COLO4_38016 [Corchorus olitorius]|uniref:Uncharacterized protein n=1 Tax=Corchorus olitorius TaxID=93759 RepID=A0A1R3FXL6_9ROSI|nr:hypothetical protein COLO4_38016 [Corchorus olitorius]
MLNRDKYVADNSFLQLIVFVANKSDDVADR